MARLNMLSRRRMLSLSVATAVTAGCAGPLEHEIRLAADQPPRKRLLMPPLLDTRARGRLALTARTGESNFLGGAPTTTAGFNQGYLGPTIVMRDGALAAEVENRIGETISVHWHGLLVPGEHDGGPHSPIEPGKRWAIDMQLDQPPSTAWYHSHGFASTARHVYYGLAGVIHYSDGRDDARGLPSRYGIDDLTLVLQDRRFDAGGRMVYGPDGTDILNGFHGERIIVNGQFNAVAVVPKGIVRLRILNGSNARVFTVHMNDRRDMHVIASDAGYLAKPDEANFVRLAPGNRVELLVEFAQGPPPILMSASGLSMRLLDFVVDERLSARVQRVPASLDMKSFPQEPAQMRTRRIALNMGGSSVGQGKLNHASHGTHAHRPVLGVDAKGELPGVSMSDFAINGRPHDMSRIDFDVPLGSFERWIIGGGGAGVEHPFHVHGVHFRVVRQGGIAPRAEDAGWKDTILASGETEIVARFDHRAGRDAPFMYHCHILEHEDSGMMGQFTVT